MENKNCPPRKCFTHGGTFHADDVFSAALLRIVYPNIEIIRGFKVPAGFEGIVFDIGGGKYDHHSTPREKRPNGVPYAAFGKLWRDYGPVLVGKSQASWLDYNFVQQLDYADNGGPNNPMSGAIAGMNPIWNRDESYDELFNTALSFAMTILNRQLEVCKARNAALDKLEDAKNQPGNIAILEKYAPIISELSGSNKHFVVFPSIRGGWNAQVVPVSQTSLVASVPFPRKWWGAPEDRLPEDITFCHASGFLVAAKTKEAAICACEIAIQEKNNCVSNKERKHFSHK